VALSALESTLRAWLREQLPLPDEVGDVSFESPEGTWGTSLTRPTVNLFLFDITRAAHQPVAMASHRDPDGVLVRDLPAPAIAFGYLLSAWGGGVREEHRLLGDAVKAVLRTPFLSPDPDGGELVGPVHLTMSDPDLPRGMDLWSSLGGRLRASLVLVATTAVTLDRPQPVAASVQRVEVDVARRMPDPRPEARADVPADDEDESTGRRFVWLSSSRQRARGRG
jgi:hypothetical protein